MSNCPFTLDELADYNSKYKTTRWENVRLLLIDQWISWTVNKELSNFQDLDSDLFSDKDQVWIDTDNSKDNILIVQTHDDWRATWDEKIQDGQLITIAFNCVNRLKAGEPLQLPDRFGKNKPYPITQSHLSDLESASMNNPDCKVILDKMKSEHGFKIIEATDPAARVHDYSVMFMYPNQMKVFDIKVEK